MSEDYFERFIKDHEERIEFVVNFAKAVVKDLNEIAANNSLIKEKIIKYEIVVAKYE